MLKITIEGLEDGTMVLEGEGVIFTILKDQQIKTGIKGKFKLEELFNTMARTNEIFLEALKRFEK